MATAELISKALLLLGRTYRQELDDDLTFEAYHIGLRDVSDAALSKAVDVSIRTRKFLPTPAELRVDALCGGGGFDHRADLAWHEFDKAVAKHGGDHSVSFADGLINATVRLLGGWVPLCEKEGDNYFVWLAKEFKATYVRLCQGPQVSAELRRPLIGRYENENRVFSNEQLEFANPRGNVNLGQVVTVATRQPVLSPPTDRPRLTGRAGTQHIADCLPEQPKQITAEAAP